MPRALSTLLWPCVCASALGLLWSAAWSRSAGESASPLGGASAPQRDTAVDPLVSSALVARGPAVTSLQARSSGTRRAAAPAHASARGPRWSTDSERVTIGAQDLARSIEWRASEAELAELARWIVARPDLDAALASRDPLETGRFNAAAADWHKALIALVGVRGAERVAAQVELVLIDHESREPVRVGLEGRFMALPLRVARD